MNNVKAIRERLNVTQQVLAAALGCTQGNVSNYESGGQTFPTAAAAKLIDFAGKRGLRITFEHIYGSTALPALKTTQPRQRNQKAEV